MTLTLYDQDFDSELLTKVTEAVNSPDEEITIYLFSDGGCNSVCNVLLNIIENDRDRFKLFGYELLSSSAFEFFVKAECKKELMPLTIGMIHQGFRTVSINDNLKPSDRFNKEIIERTKRYAKNDDENFIQKLGLKPKELREYKKGNDVYFQYDRFIEIIDNYKTSLL